MSERAPPGRPGEENWLASVSRRAWTRVWLPVLLVLVVAAWAATHFVKPAPPREIVFASGPDGSAYQVFLEGYRKFLAKDGIRIVERRSAGARENYRLLRDQKEHVDVAFVRSGIGDVEQAPHLVTLGVVAQEALWVFCRGSGILDDLPDLAGKSVAIGAKGAGTRRLVRTLLRANGVEEADFTALEIGGAEAAEALLTGKAQCVFLFEPPEAGVLKALLYSPDAHLVDFSRRADAYTKHIPALRKVVLPEGANDLEANRPDRPVTLLAAQTQLLAREDLHSAIQMLLLQAASELHGDSGLFHVEHDFPAARAFEFPVSEDAKRYYASGRPFLQRYLPFWIANLIDRALVVIVPLLAIVIPLVRIVPPLYAWSVRRRIYRWYGELMFIENEMRRTLTHGEKRDFRERLEWINREVNELQAPVAFANQVYALRQHVDFVRGQLENVRSRGAADATPA